MPPWVPLSLLAAQGPAFLAKRSYHFLGLETFTKASLLNGCRSGFLAQKLSFTRRSFALQPYAAVQ